MRFEIGELVEVIGPFVREPTDKTSLAIIVDNVPRPGKDTVKIFWHGDVSTWVPINWIKKIKNEDNGE
jgi:hypothetical protein|tara:strand:+ start:304 stop:507 length:204 start_codon:yes stop_codon:yes gene_type:complete